MPETFDEVRKAVYPTIAIRILMRDESIVGAATTQYVLNNYRMSLSAPDAYR